MTIPQVSPPGVTINDILNKLRVSRSFITRNISPFVPHSESKHSKKAIVYFDENDFREWLRSHATFTRQTCRIPRKLYDEIPSYQLRPLNPLKRNETEAMPVKSHDFWDLSLIFPKEYHGDRHDITRLSSSEICYRDMYKTGAVKIQLGSQKTMFYIPDPSTSYGQSGSLKFLTDPYDIQQLADLPLDDSEFPLVAAYNMPENISHILEKETSSIYRIRNEAISHQEPNKSIYRMTIDVPENVYNYNEKYIRDILQKIASLNGQPPITGKKGLSDQSVTYAVKRIDHPYNKFDI